MSDYDWEEEPYVVIERNEPGVSSFLAGLAVGAGLALLFAPRTGADTRRDLQEKVRKVGDQAQDFVSGVTDSVGQKLTEARETVENRIDATRESIELKRRQMSRAVDAGRAAAQQSRYELEQRIAETKAAYKES
ncbi:MAG: YtxH domain-containing protein [Gemmatimonadota bacterium]|nr:YtxH domain-containing protein [Gemmatimonadota bacterium]